MKVFWPLLCAALLAGCGESTPPKPAAGNAAAPSQAAGSVYDRVAAQGTGFTVGNMMAARVVYVFFDAQCPHCATLWKESKPLLGQVRMVWMPVRLLADISARQGAALLTAKDPAAEMDRHEALRDRDGKGMQPPAQLPEDALGQVKGNTELWVSIGGGAVPYMVYKAPGSGAASAYEGATDTEGLKKLLGI
jgi:thiol:disulfide interchange protein DsbG